jgi:hypothetical protein
MSSATSLVMPFSQNYFRVGSPFECPTLNPLNRNEALPCLLTSLKYDRKGRDIYGSWLLYKEILVLNSEKALPLFEDHRLCITQHARFKLGFDEPSNPKPTLYMYSPYSLENRNLFKRKGFWWWHMMEHIQINFKNRGVTRWRSAKLNYE